MRIATILFTYNRSTHTKQVLDALSRNTVLPEKLFIFHDGLKEEQHKEEWLKVKEIIRNVTFCDNEVVEAEKNKGLATSIVDGINYVMQKYDGVIVLEDDCVSAPNFISFMNQCLNKYENNLQVYTVSGYAWPIELEESEYDVYFSGRFSSWGWGTWKNRWVKYNQDEELLNRLSSKKEESEYLACWGRDLPAMFQDRMNGKNDSWAVFWALNIIENHGVNIVPYKSVIKNIGLDGTGVHCANVRDYDVNLYGDIESFKLPDNVCITESARLAFVKVYGSILPFQIESTYKEKVIIYGLGNFFHSNENVLAEKYCIVALIDKNLKGFYAGMQIMIPSEIEKSTFDKLIIMIRDSEESNKVKEEFINLYNIAEQKIIIGYEISN